jgi:hypothetical protein
MPSALLPLGLLKTARLREVEMTTGRTERLEEEEECDHADLSAIADGVGIPLPTLGKIPASATVTPTALCSHADAVLCFCTLLRLLSWLALARLLDDDLELADLDEEEDNIGNAVLLGEEEEQTQDAEVSEEVDAAEAEEENLEDLEEEDLEDLEEEDLEDLEEEDLEEEDLEDLDLEDLEEEDLEDLDEEKEDLLPVDDLLREADVLEEEEDDLEDGEDGEDEEEEEEGYDEQATS